MPAFALLLLASSAAARTYFVDPATGSDGNSGLSASTPWKTPPGTRTSSNNGFVSAAWGTIDGTTRVACGDVVLFRPGRTQTRAQAGAWCIANNGDAVVDPICNAVKRFYAPGCTYSNPITFRIATPAEWPGAPPTGHFTIDGTGVTGTQVAAADLHGMLIVGLMQGFVMQGLDANRRFVVIGPTGAPAGSNGACAALTTTSGNSWNTDFAFDWLELRKAEFGLCVGMADRWRVSNTLIHSNECHGINIGLHVDKPTNNGALVDVEVFGNGTSDGCRPFNSDGIYQQGVRRQWNVRVKVHDEQTNCLQAGSARQNGIPPQAATFRSIWRDGEFYKCGIYPLQNGRSGIAGDGDGDLKPPHAYMFFQRPIVYGNPGNGVWTNHGSGRMNIWNATIFANATAGTGAGQITWDRTSDIFEIHNSLIVPRSYSSSSFRWNSSAAIFDTKLLSNYNLIDFVSGPTDMLAGFRWTQAWPSTKGSFQSAAVSFANAASQLGFGGGNDYVSTEVKRYQPRFVSLAGGCDNPSVRTYSDCDFRLCEGPGSPVSGCPGASDAIDAGTFFLRAASAGSGNSITVTLGDALSALAGTDADAAVEYGDPRNFFIAPGSYPGATGDAIQIQGACGRRNVTALTNTSITFDGPPCSWALRAGVHLPWNGNAPDLGAREAQGEGSTRRITAPVLLQVEPLP